VRLHLRGQLATALSVVALLALGAASLPASAQAFGIETFSVNATEENGSLDRMAGTHPYALTTEINFKQSASSEPGGPYTEGDLKDLHIELPSGLIENPSAIPTCTQLSFNTPRQSPFQESLSGESCPDDTQIGVVALHTSFEGGSTRYFGIFNLAPPTGVPSEWGFSAFGNPTTFIPHLRSAEGEYGITLSAVNFSQRFDLYGMRLTLWGAPWLINHDNERGNCLNEEDPADHFGEPGMLLSSYKAGTCSVGGDPNTNPPKAYLTLPESCTGLLDFSTGADSWQDPATLVSESWHQPGELEGCERLDLLFSEFTSTQPTSTTASTPTGLDFSFESRDEGLTEPTHPAPSQAKTAVLTLPEGMTINPSLGAGLGICTPAQYAAEAPSSVPGTNCPNSSKIGDVSVQSPLFEGPLQGSIFLAEPFQNPFGSMLALYLVARSPQRGVIVSVPGELTANTASGQLTATFEDLPQLPYSRFSVQFRSGQRAPLITPAGCGQYPTRTELMPWPAPEVARHVGSQFSISSGIGNGPCPTGAAPFQPLGVAGTINPQAGAYTPFYLRLTRTDSEQEITSYSAVLPPGLLGKIAGIPFCPDAAIEAAKAMSGTATEEHPSCPAASEIGHTVSGFGVGGALAYAPGGLYLAGPYHGAPLSIVAIDSAKVGPFDLGTIVVRSAIEVNPISAQVSIDSRGSDPIPHIVDGIPLHLRDIRVYISRPDFTVNPTSCQPFSIDSSLTGSAAPFTNPADVTATTSDPFQVLFCSELGFAPGLRLNIAGNTRHGGFPTLKAVVTPHAGNANIASAAVTLPPSIFLEQRHIRAICTRPEAETEACPDASAIGTARAETPLLGTPMEGTVYLRASSRTLPDIFTVLHGDGIRIVLEGHVDSHRNGIRATFEGLPDAPVTRFVMTIFGGRKHGLLVNSKNLCGAPQIANARLVGQSNVGEELAPRLAVRCPRKRHKSHKHRATHRHGGRGRR
jgi:hypothetical protein